MKTEAGIRHRVRQAQFRHLQRALRRAESRKPESCAHQERLALPGFGPVGFCGKEEGADHAPCDVRFGGAERAAKCPIWEAAIAAEEVRESFRAFWESRPTLGEIATRFPDIASLLWVISTLPGDDAPEALFDPSQHLRVDGGPSPYAPAPRALLAQDPWGAFPGGRLLVGPHLATVLEP